MRLSRRYTECKFNEPRRIQLLFDCLFYNKDVFKSVHVLTVNCQQSVNKYQTRAAD